MSEDRRSKIIGLNDIVIPNSVWEPEEKPEDSELTSWVGSEHDELSWSAKTQEAAEIAEKLQGTNSVESFADAVNNMQEIESAREGWSAYEASLLESEARKQGTSFPVMTPYPEPPEMLEPPPTENQAGADSLETLPFSESLGQYASEVNNCDISDEMSEAQWHELDFSENLQAYRQEYLQTECDSCSQEQTLSESQTEGEGESET
jgi:hypothetical protein